MTVKHLAKRIFRYIPAASVLLQTVLLWFQLCYLGLFCYHTESEIDEYYGVTVSLQLACGNEKKVSLWQIWDLNKIEIRQQFLFASNSNSSCHCLLEQKVDKSSQMKRDFSYNTRFLCSCSPEVVMIAGDL